MPYRVDRRLGHADFAICQQHPPVGRQPALGDPLPDLRHRDARRRDRDRRAHVDAVADRRGKDLADEVPPRVERHDLGRVAPLRARRDQGRRRGVGQVGAVVAGQGPGGDRQRAVNAVGAGVGADGVAPARLGRARDYRPALARVGRTPAQRDRERPALPGCEVSRMWRGIGCSMSCSISFHGNAEINQLSERKP